MAARRRRDAPSARSAVVATACRGPDRVDAEGSARVAMAEASAAWAAAAVGAGRVRLRLRLRLSGLRFRPANAARLCPRPLCFAMSMSCAAFGCCPQRCADRQAEQQQSQRLFFLRAVGARKERSTVFGERSQPAAIVRVQKSLATVQVDGWMDGWRGALDTRWSRCVAAMPATRYSESVSRRLSQSAPVSPRQILSQSAAADAMLTATCSTPKLEGQFRSNSQHILARVTRVTPPLRASATDSLTRRASDRPFH